MGFLSNLKSNLTGDWASVSLRVGEARRGAPVAVGVDVAVKEKDISVERLLVEVRCEEVVHVPNHHPAGADRPYDVHQSTSLHTAEVVVSGPLQLAGGAQQSFEGQVPIPGHLPPTFTGRNARVEWSIRARLEMKGNDPDSDWTPLAVQ